MKWHRKPQEGTTSIKNVVSMISGDAAIGGKRGKVPRGGSLTCNNPLTSAEVIEQ